VVGAGISGLVAAAVLHNESMQVRVLESRDRVGGRALSQPIGAGGIDLGPAWVWPAVQPRITHWLEALQLESIEQFETGLEVRESTSGIERRRGFSRYSDAVRVRGGLQRVAQGLAEKLGAAQIKFDAKVQAVTKAEDTISIVLTSGEVIETHRLIVAVPGPIVAAWEWKPCVPEPLMARSSTKA